MVRRSSLIIAASLAVLSTFEPGALCFAAAAPAVPPVEDRFERPRFLKREIKRYVFANTTMTSQSQTTTEESSTPVDIRPEVTPTQSFTPEQIAASISAASLASAEASWSAAHPGIPFMASLPDTTTNPAPPTSNPPAAESSKPPEPPAQVSSSQPAAVSVSESISVSVPLPPGQSESQGPAQGPSTAVSAAGESNNGGNQPGPTPSSSAGVPVVPPVGGQPSSQSPAGQSTPVIPGNGDSSHSSSNVQQTGGQEVGGQSQTNVQGQESNTQGGGLPVSAPAVSIPTTGGGPQTGGQETGGQATDSTGGIIGVIPSVTPPVIPGPIETSVRFGSTPPANPPTSGAQPASTGAGQPVQTANPATGTAEGVSAGSSPTDVSEQSSNPVFPLPASNTNSLLVALSSALAVSVSASVPLNIPPSIVNSLGQTVPNPELTGTPAPVSQAESSGAPVVVASSTNAAGVVLPITSTPAQITGGAPIVFGSSTDAEGKVVPFTSVPAAVGSIAPVVSGSVPLVVGSSTDSLGNVVPITSVPPVSAVSGSIAPVVSGSVAPPVIIGSSTNSLGNVVPITSVPPVPAVSGSVAPVVSGSVAPPVIIGSSTNPEGQLVPITSAPPAASGSVAPAESGSVPPVIIGSSTNSLGQVIPITSTPPSESSGAPVIIGSSTNSLGQFVPITSSPVPPASYLGQQSSGPPVSGSQETPNAVPNLVGSQSAQSIGAGASEPAGSQGQTAGGVVPLQTTAGAAGPASTLSNALPIATASQTYNTDENAPLTQKPTAYDSMTAQAVGSSIEMASSSSPTATSDFSETGLPTGVPLVLYPPTGPVNRPENTELIQIGFLYPLNYDFVWQHEESQRQIFKYLPIGIAFGLEIDVTNVTMQTLRAWDTTRDLHYITTLALAWIPSQLVDSLGLILHTQAEKFYHNPDPAVRTLLSMINPALPIRADNATDGGSETGVGASPTGTGSANNQGTIANGINNSSPVKASSVGIGVGVVCGAAAYGAAMFFVARRYKKRRQSHLRSPSMYSSPVMSHHGADPAAAAALMSGGMGERSMSPYYDNDRGPSRGSGRSGSSAGRQQISAPVMAENSLGWN